MSVIVVAGEPGIIAARQATTTVPIVMAAVGDPVGRGFVASLARPGGNITGVSNMAVEMTGKWVELLKEAVPKAIKVAALRNPTNPTHAVLWSQTQEAARALGVQAQPAEAKTVEEIDLAFAAMVKERPGALIVFPDPLFAGNRVRVAGLAERYRLPWLGMFRESSTDVGALMSYGPNALDNYRRAAGFVDRILKGAKPADMPVEQARQFELASTVRPEEADVFSGRQPRRGKSQSPVTRVAGWRETKTLKPTDQAIGRMVSESPGRNESERIGGPDIPKIRRPSLTVERRRQYGPSHLADAAGHSGGVRATAR